MSQISSTCVFTPVHAGDAVGSKLDGLRVGDTVGVSVVGANVGTAVGVEENGAWVGNAVGARDGVPVVGEVVLGPRVGFGVRGANRQDGVPANWIGSISVPNSAKHHPALSPATMKLAPVAVGCSAFTCTAQSQPVLCARPPPAAQTGC